MGLGQETTAIANYNKVILVGNLTRDPQLSYTPNNVPVCDFGLAVNRRWRGEDGNQREETCFVDLRAYRRAAETINQYMSKGQPILIEGHLEFQQWTTPEGQRRSRHMVIVERFQFMGRAAGATGAGPSEAGGPPPPSDEEVPPGRGPSGGGASSPPAQPDQTPPAPGQKDDIPF